MVATEGGDRAAARQLVDSFLPAIGGMARRFDIGGVERSELMQEGVSGLLLAAKRYDPGSDTPFWGYASFWAVSYTHLPSPRDLSTSRMPSSA